MTAGIDLDPSCRYPYEANNNAQFIEADVSSVKPRDILDLYKDAEVKILAGCAPCQPFSTYAQRYGERRDEKWGLLYEFSRLAKGAKPDVITMENVPKLIRHEVFLDFVRTLEKLGYKTWYEVVDCSSFGVPQTRKRLVMLASMHGEIKLEAAKPTAPKTVQQVIGKLQPLAAGEASARDPLHVAATLTPLNLKRIRVSRPGGTWRDWPKNLVADCHKSEQGKSFPSVYGRMEWDKPAPTMTTQCYGFGNGRFGHPDQDRAISLREAAILQSFPKNYKFLRAGEEVNFKTLGRLIGNAVPVNLGRAIARSIKAHISAFA